MNNIRHSPLLKRIEFLLLIAGILCAGYCSSVALQFAASRRASMKFGQQVEAAARGPSQEARGLPSSGSDAAPPSVMGRLEIPAIRLSVPILSNYENESLLKGIGHIPGTAMPGGLGTLGLAGHRDTYFRPLRNIKTKMEIRVADSAGVFHYVVDSTEVVKPEDVGVLDIGARPALTLITCYPFYYVGAAPMRFIVHAHLISALPDPAQ